MWRGFMTLVFGLLIAAAAGAQDAGQIAPKTDATVAAQDADPTFTPEPAWRWPEPAWWDPTTLRLMKGEFYWTLGEPLVGPAVHVEDPCYSIKDPSIVQHNGRWHLFCTIRSQKRSHQIEYLSFDDWKNADKAERHVLKLSDAYCCAPQVFYFALQKKWYLICQVIDNTRKPLQPAWSTNDDIANPEGWSKPTLFFAEQPANVRIWIDFWVICDDLNAYLFFTSLDGQLWRAETTLESFPGGWRRPLVALRGDFLEAAHIYSMPRLRRYLAIVEAQDTGRRYYKAYLSTRLNGDWWALADNLKKPFASPGNIKETGQHWAESISHGEMIRQGEDEKLEIDPFHMRFLIQSVREEEKAGKNYGQIPWRLGILEATEPPAGEGR